MKMSRAEGKELVPRNISFVVGKYFEFGPSDAKRDTLHFFEIWLYVVHIHSQYITHGSCQHTPSLEKHCTAMDGVQEKNVF